MLYAMQGKQKKIEKVERKENALVLTSQRGILRLKPVNEACVRVTYTEREDFSKKKNRGIIEQSPCKDWEYSETKQQIVLNLKKLTIVVNRETGSCQYYDEKDNCLLKEREQDCRTLEEFSVYRLVAGAGIQTEKIQTPDGIKEVVREALREKDKSLYHTRLYLEWQDEEALYGLGQHEEGILNLRGHMLYLHQSNRKIAIPYMVSSLGYGILVNTNSPMIFSDTEFGSYLYTEADEEQDYYVVNGGSMEGAVRGYRQLTGKAALLPKWAFGYIQSQERYETAEEICNVAEEYRKRNIGLDGIVLDWCSWPDGMWGQKSFDTNRFSNPLQMTEILHEKDVHFMISIWPNMDENCENYKEMKQKGQILPGSSIYNAMSEEGRKVYWKQAYEGLYQYGVDGWWCDSSEPLTPEWSHRERVEPSVQYAEYCRQTADTLSLEEGNAYALYHAQALYEGQRGADIFNTLQKRVINLTRSAWTGQQRYGTILWSGDTAASWETLRKQITAGISFCASGLPYWTADIGAFFVKNGDLWYWKGDYNDTTKDAGYRELFVRWFQWGAFLPIFRGHGTDCRRELWMFGIENSDAGGFGDRFYQALLEMNSLRYKLMPYIYSQAGRVWLEDGSMMKPLAFDFSKDTKVFNIEDQYLFGDSLMICPITKAMYFEVGSKPLQRSSYTRSVYLPAGCGWYDYWTHAFYEGGQMIETEAPLEKIPIFVKVGSILPLTQVKDRVQVQEEIHWQVFGGRDGQFTLYQDAGDGYGYENGEYECTCFYWSDKERKLTDDKGNEYPCDIVED